MFKVGFDNDLYIQKQSEQISKRIKEFGGKLYLEFGGKLFDDYHASRVLPGFKPDSKLQMLKNIGSDVEIVIVINASDIQNNKIRRDLGITYDSDVLRLIDAFRAIGLLSAASLSRSIRVSPPRLHSRTGLKISAYASLSTIPLRAILIISRTSSAKRASARMNISKPSARSLL